MKHFTQWLAQSQILPHIVSQGGGHQIAKMWLRRGQVHARAWKGPEDPSVEKARRELLDMEVA